MTLGMVIYWFVLMMEIPLGLSQGTLCPVDWIVRSSSCYYVNRDVKSFHDAGKFCQRRQAGAHLASISSEQENAEISDVLKPVDQSIYMWIGLWLNGTPTANSTLWRDANREGWVWTDGSKVNDDLANKTWWDDEPYGYYRCGALYQGKWAVQPCYLSLPSMCEFALRRNPVCPNEMWVPGIDSCYFIERNVMTFHNASQSCQNRYPGAKLAAVSSEKENSVINDLITNKYNYVWIGLWLNGTPTNDATLWRNANRQGWVWTDGSKVNDDLANKSWSDGEPYGSYRCAAFHQGSWSGRPCNEDLPSLCEFALRLSSKIAQGTTIPITEATGTSVKVTMVTNTTSDTCVTGSYLGVATATVVGVGATLAIIILVLVSMVVILLRRLSLVKGQKSLAESPTDHVYYNNAASVSPTQPSDNTHADISVDGEAAMTGRMGMPGSHTTMQALEDGSTAQANQANDRLYAALEESIERNSYTAPYTTLRVP